MDFATNLATKGFLSGGSGIITKGILLEVVTQGITETIKGFYSSPNLEDKLKKEVKSNKYYVRVIFTVGNKKHSAIGFHNKDIKLKVSDVKIKEDKNSFDVKISGLDKVIFYPDVKIKF